MTLIEISAILLAFFFGVLAVALSLIEERTRKAMRIQSSLQKQKIFQISILKEIQDRIGYSLDTEEVVDVITGSLKHIFPYSTVSSMVIKEDRIIFKTSVEESVSHAFIENVKVSMLASLRALLPEVDKKVDEVLSGAPLDDTNFLSLSSFFHIPLVVNNRVVGLINLSSTKSNLYKEDEMTILYQITAQASNALTRLMQVLETEKGKLTSLISSLADGVFMLDSQKQVLIINDSARRFLRLHPSTSSGPQPSFFDILSSFPKEYDLIAVLEKVSVNKIAATDLEVTLGDNVFQTFITPVISSEGNTIGISFLLHDVTLEKNLSRIKEDFTNMMVHELRAPLTAVKDSSELMIENKKLSDKDRQDLLGVINSQAKLLLEQIADLLDAAKIEAGRFVLNRTQNDLVKVIKDVEKTFLPAAQTRKISLSSKIGPLPIFIFDKIRITQVLNNLVSNSLKFTPEGGQIRISASISGNDALVSVSDTGIGIPIDKQKEVFSKFYQVGTVEYKEGSGLGLFVVKGIVEAHNGKVTLESEEGKGTTVSFYLPLNITQSLSPNYRTLN